MSTKSVEAERKQTKNTKIKSEHGSEAHSRDGSLAESRLGAHLGRVVGSGETPRSCLYHSTSISVMASIESATKGWLEGLADLLEHVLPTDSSDHPR